MSPKLSTSFWVVILRTLETICGHLLLKVIAIMIANVIVYGINTQQFAQIISFKITVGWGMMGDYMIELR